MLLDQLTTDVMQAMKAQDKTRVETLRFLIAAIKKFEIDTYLPGKGGALSETDAVKILRTQVKTHEESIAAFKKGNRNDLVEKEEKEITILKAYLPQEMADEDIKKIAAEVKAKGVTEFGPLMGMVMKEVAGRAGGERVAKAVKALL